MKQYLRPVALLYGSDAALSRATGKAGALGGGAIGFAGVELIERDRRSLKRDYLSYMQARGSGDAVLCALLDEIERPRAALSGLEGSPPFVMGIVNVTPDSFSDGGEHEDPQEAIVFARDLIRDGADILDIGGESTRPGAEPVPVQVELDRVLPIIHALEDIHAPISIDTRKAAVMDDAVAAGARIINDVTALSYDADSLKVAAKLKCPVILMHALSDPLTMQNEPRYDNALLDIYDYLSERIDACQAAGIEKSRLIADPGIGFGKTVQHNLELLQGFSLFHGLGVALGLGTSRKGFIGIVSGVEAPQQRLAGSLASALTGAAQGAHILRVHDVAQTAQALAVHRAISAV